MDTKTASQSSPWKTSPHGQVHAPLAGGKDRQLPWRVSMALSRLRRDLHNLPLYKGAAPEEIRRTKLQVINDVIRPIRTPELLKDFLVNCDLVAAEIAVLEETQIEREIVGDLSEEMLVATAWELIKDLEQPGATPVKTPGEGSSAQVTRQLVVLQEVVDRLCSMGSAVKQDLLDSYLKHQAVSPEKLPAGITRIIETQRLADTFLARKDKFVDSLGRIQEDDSGRQLAAMVQRVLPELLQRGEHQSVARVLQAVNAGRRTSPLLEEVAGALSHAMAADDPIARLLTDLDSQDKDRRNDAVEILVFMGERAGPGLLETYASSQSKPVRMSAFEAIRRIGGNVLQSLLAQLPDIEADWFVIFHILETLGEQEDASLAQPISRFLHHTRVHVRQAALTVLFKMQGPLAEPYFVQALKDQEGAVRKMAVAYLGRIKSRHPRAVEFYVRALQGDDPLATPENEAFLIEVCHALASCEGLSADAISKAESALLAALRPLEPTGVLGWLKKPSPQLSERLRSAIGEALAAVRKSAGVGVAASGNRERLTFP